MDDGFELRKEGLRYLTPFNMVGAKNTLAQKIVPFIESIEHRLYVEPFGGAGGLLLNKPAPRVAEVYNDRNRLFCNLFRTLKDEAKAARIAELAFSVPPIRCEYEKMKRLCLAYFHPDNELEPLRNLIEACGLGSEPDDVALAYAAFYCMNCTFRGVVLDAFAPVEAGRPNTTLWLKAERLRCINERLKNVVVEERDVFECIQKLDREWTLFYLDPPYICTETNTYLYSWAKPEHEKLVEVLCEIKGKAILSCYDDPTYLPLLKHGFEKVDFTHKTCVCNAAKGRGRTVETLYIKR